MCGKCDVSVENGQKCGFSRVSAVLSLSWREAQCATSHESLFGNAMTAVCLILGSGPDHSDVRSYDLRTQGERARALLTRSARAAPAEHT
jgi:hypothetical protein